ncbi:hypothetical protein B4119_1782 [Parageobacillus caldoxylosilyticus]|uniref:Uncharacterized protein n=1 Tax=Saccharococcus caldoxylosilyticus TaxID=81408 RepID=A0A150LWS0_9BACL|nr:hypothetical protein B4119_1782 [Parageobacillus caldoxylosilyticus]BDG35925.1 hypothetical protein PcaKH15_18310 [Parageobacillus caldoxylosilyticus]BDG39707.1 hypothetical protein PcaKH16_18460 [Parageobacillus caldoxylosilyticus]BDG43477.1 hypothetical protein PcaKH35_18220 [Parageobacillus caldoxylosilyticus]
MFLFSFAIKRGVPLDFANKHFFFSGHEQAHPIIMRPPERFLSNDLAEKTKRCIVDRKSDLHRRLTMLIRDALQDF